MGRLRKHLCTSALLAMVHKGFLRVPEPGSKQKREIL